MDDDPMDDDSPNLFEETVQFETVWQAVRGGDPSAQALVVERIMPKMLECVARRFGSCQAFDPEDAVASAVRTIHRREWELTRGRGDHREPIEPTGWGDLVGLLVAYAINKGRTLQKKRPLRQLPGSTADDEGSLGHWQPVDQAVSPSLLAVRQEMREDLQEAVESLNESLGPMHRIILRGYLDGATTKEICEELRCRGIHRVEASVRTAWRRKIVPELTRMMAGHA